MNLSDDSSTIARELEDRGYADAAREIARRHGIPIYTLLGRGRAVSIMRARQELYAELRRRGLSFPEIGKLLDRDHSTILQGLRRFHSQVGASLEPEMRIRVAI